MENATKFYAGIGSRRTPFVIRELMGNIAKQLYISVYVLRTGDATGADKAFRDAIPDCKEVYVPSDATPKAVALAKSFHAAWHMLNDDHCRNLHGRNALQILGKNLNTPVEFVICWTKDMCTSHAGERPRSVKTGGTGTAISIADSRNIKVYNLSIKAHREFWESWLEDPKPITLGQPKAQPPVESKFTMRDKMTKTAIKAEAKGNGYTLAKNGSKNLIQVCSACNADANTFIKETADIGTGEIVVIEAYACICGWRDRSLRGYIPKAA